jgi:hypothetical protein
MCIINKSWKLANAKWELANKIKKVTQFRYSAGYRNWIMHHKQFTHFAKTWELPMQK